MAQTAHLPKSQKKRVVIVGGGFAGTRLAGKLLKSNFQVVLIDRNNYYQFQPLLYQVAIAGLEPSAVSYPLRRMFQGKSNDFHFRLATLQKINTEINSIQTNIGEIDYDYLVIASGVTTNFFGNKKIEEKALTLKSVVEAIQIRNAILGNLENSINCTSDEERTAFLNIAIVGGGPAGVELAGALAEMKTYILPKDYPDYDFHQLNIILIEASDKILGAMSEESSKTSLKYLKKLKVDVRTNMVVKDYDGTQLMVNDETIPTKTLVWTAGVTAPRIEGFGDVSYGHANRLNTDEYNKIKGMENIFAIGDIALMTTTDYPKGHPQTAPAALQQANHLAKNLELLEKNQPMKPFKYFDKGSMTSIGRNLAVADIGGLKLKGFIAWFVWSFLHLFSIVGGKNKILIFIDWATNYLIYNPSLRLLIKPRNIE